MASSVNFVDTVIEALTKEMASRKLRLFSTELNTKVHGYADYENPLSSITPEVQEAINTITSFQATVFERESRAEIEGRFIKMLRGDNGQ